MRAEKPNNITRGKDGRAAQPHRFIGFIESGAQVPKTLTLRLTERRGRRAAAPRPRAQARRGRVWLPVLQGAAVAAGDRSPRARADCVGAARPCPWVSCRYHLYLDVSAAGSLLIAHPALAPWEIPETCALDVAERGLHTLDEVGQLLNVTRERVRQIEVVARLRLRAATW